MKNILIIVANPKIDSFSFAMADKYKTVSEVNNNIVEIIDLYRDEHQQSFFTYENAHDIPVTKEMRYYQKKISQANEIVFVFPYWWGSMPAILKNFFDWNLSSGFAYSYIDSKPLGLLSNKTVKVFTTTGAPNFLYMLTGANRRLKNMFKKQIVEFSGMKLEEFNIFGSIDTSVKKTNEILNNIK